MWADMLMESRKKVGGFAGVVVKVGGSVGVIVKVASVEGVAVKVGEDVKEERVAVIVGKWLMVDALRQVRKKPDLLQ